MAGVRGPGHLEQRGIEIPEGQRHQWHIALRRRHLPVDEKVVVCPHTRQNQVQVTHRVQILVHGEDPDVGVEHLGPDAELVQVLDAPDRVEVTWIGVSQAVRMVGGMLMPSGS